jgi:hypothetical protein
MLAFGSTRHGDLRCEDRSILSGQRVIAKHNVPDMFERRHTHLIAGGGCYIRPEICGLPGSTLGENQHRKALTDTPSRLAASEEFRNRAVEPMIASWLVDRLFLSRLSQGPSQQRIANVY